MTERPPLITRIERRDVTAAVTSQIAVDRSTNLFTGRDTIFGASGETKTYDWPNPNAYLRRDPMGVAVRAQAEVWQDNLPTLLRGHDKFFDGDGLAPDYDWPNPYGHLRKNPYGSAVKSQSDVWDNPSSTRFIGRDTFFNGSGKAPNYDWPNPAGHLRNNPAGASVKSQSDVWDNPSNTRLVGHDRIFRGDGEVPTYDYPNPRGPISCIELRSWIVNLADSTLFPTSPFYLIDWPNPRGPSQSLENKTFLNAYEIDLVGQDTFFAGPGQVPTFDYTNPVLRKDDVSRRTWLQGFASFFSAVLPFGLADWPNPRAPIQPKQPDSPPSLSNILYSVYMPSGWVQGVPWGPTFPVSLRTHIDGQSKVFGQDFLPPGGPDYDYSNPILRKDDPGQRTWLLNLSQFFSALAPPFAWFDWFVPKVRQPSIDLRTHVDPYKLNLVGRDILPPGGQDYDYPNPRGYVPGISLRTWVDPYKITLIGQDLLPTGGPDYDYPNPRGPSQGSIERRTWTSTSFNQLLVLAAAPFYLTEWPVPRGPVPPKQPENLPELQNNLYTVYVPSSWCMWVPWAPAFPTELRTHISGQRLVLSGQDLLPAGGPDYDYPNPRGYVPSIALKTWLDAYKLNLQGLDAFFAAPGQAPRYDYPNPLRVPPRPDPVAPSSLLGTLYSILAPFAMLDWPNPFGKLFPIVGRSHLDPLKINLTGRDTFYWAQGQAPVFDYPNPRGYTPGISLRTWLDPYKVTLVGRDVLPTGGPDYDYPNPRGYVPVITLRTHLDPLKITLTGRDTFYWAQGQAPVFDYPNPILRKDDPGQRTWLQDLITNVLYQSTLIIPFAWFDWVVPPGARYAILLRTHLDPTKINLVGQDQFYWTAGQAPVFDYPNPRGPLPGVITLRTWIDPYKITLVGKDTIYGAQGEAPAYDYPNPRGYVPGISLRTWTAQPSLAGQDILPPGGPDYDYPNPRGYVPGISLRTWVDPYKITLVGQDSFFAGPGRAPVYDYPNPILRKDDPGQRTWIQVLADVLETILPFALLDWPVPRGYHFSSLLRFFTGRAQIRPRLPPLGGMTKDSITASGMINDSMASSGSRIINDDMR